MLMKTITEWTKNISIKVMVVFFVVIIFVFVILGIIYSYYFSDEGVWCKENGFERRGEAGFCYDCSENVAGSKICSEIYYQIPVKEVV